MITPRFSDADDREGILVAEVASRGVARSVDVLAEGIDFGATELVEVPVERADHGGVADVLAERASRDEVGRMGLPLEAFICTGRSVEEIVLVSA